MMFRAGVRLEYIAKIFGHADTRTTIRYLGLDFDDMSEAMNIFAQYQKTPFEPKSVQNRLGQEISGQRGISVPEDDWLEPVLNAPRFNGSNRGAMK